MKNYEMGEQLQENIRTCSAPSALRITDIRFADIEGSPFENSLMKIYTNQGIVGYGEVRDFSSKQYALLLKSRLLNENPLDVDRLFGRIKQFGGPARQAGGVCAVELALWDIIGKAYGVPCYQLLGGKHRDHVRVYCDTDVYGKHDGTAMGKALLARKERGYTLLKMDIGIDLLLDEPGTLVGPADILDDMRNYPDMPKFKRGGKTPAENILEKRIYDLYNIEHGFTGIHLTEKGLDFLEQYMADARAVVGYEIPICIDHIGHVGIEDCIRLLRRLEKYGIAWAEDLVPWQRTEMWKRIADQTAVPLCTGEDMYLRESFAPLLDAQVLSVIHPDILTAGGMMETKRIGELAENHGVGMAIHCAESPIAFLAAAHTATATRNFLALEHHSNDIPWWGDLVEGPDKPIIKDGYVTLSDAPGLGITELNDELIAEHMHHRVKGLWEPTDEWNTEWSHDRTWS